MYLFFHAEYSYEIGNRLHGIENSSVITESWTKFKQKFLYIENFVSIFLFIVYFGAEAHLVVLYAQVSLLVGIREPWGMTRVNMGCQSAMQLPYLLHNL